MDHLAGILLIVEGWPFPLGLMMPLCQQKLDAIQPVGGPALYPPEKTILSCTSALEQGAVSFIVKLPEMISAPIAV